MIFFRAILTKCTGLLYQRNDYSCYVSRTILAPPPLWLQKHIALRSQNFTHYQELIHKRRFANLTAPVAGDFEELLLLHKTADIRFACHLSSINHTAAVLNATMCVSARFLFWIFEDHVSESAFSFQVSQENVFCSLRGYILCICFTERTGVWIRNGT